MPVELAEDWPTADEPVVSDAIAPPVGVQAIEQTLSTVETWLPTLHIIPTYNTRLLM
jgi:hypothetical protein